MRSTAQRGGMLHGAKLYRADVVAALHEVSRQPGAEREMNALITKVSKDYRRIIMGFLGRGLLCCAEEDRRHARWPQLHDWGRPVVVCRPEAISFPSHVTADGQLGQHASI